jgi:hypothetical protein
VSPLGVKKKSFACIINLLIFKAEQNLHPTIYPPGSQANHQIKDGTDRDIQLSNQLHYRTIDTFHTYKDISMRSLQISQV